MEGDRVNIHYKESRCKWGKIPWRKGNIDALKPVQSRCKAAHGRLCTGSEAGVKGDCGVSWRVFHENVLFYSCGGGHEVIKREEVS